MYNVGYTIFKELISENTYWSQASQHASTLNLTHVLMVYSTPDTLPIETWNYWVVKQMHWCVHGLYDT